MYTHDNVYVPYTAMPSTDPLLHAFNSSRLREGPVLGGLSSELPTWRSQPNGSHWDLAKWLGGGRYRWDGGHTRWFPPSDVWWFRTLSNYGYLPTINHGEIVAKELGHHLVNMKLPINWDKTKRWSKTIWWCDVMWTYTENYNFSTLSEFSHIEKSGDIS